MDESSLRCQYRPNELPSSSTSVPLRQREGLASDPSLIVSAVGGHSAELMDGLPNELHINDLPEEVLVRIMSYLSLFHRKITRQVCQYWNNISYQRSLIQDDWMTLRTVNDLKILEKRHPDHKFINLRILKIAYEYEECGVWQTFGPYIQKIELHDVENTRNRVLVDIFTYCTDLKSLSLGHWLVVDKEKWELARRNSVSFAEIIPTTALSTLTSIRVEHEHGGFLTDGEFHALTRNARNLTEIAIKCPRLLDNTSSDIKCSSFTNLLKRQSNVITDLKISGHTCGNLSGLLSCVGKQLISLDISYKNRSELGDDCLKMVCELFPNLKVLNLSYTSLSDKDFKLLFTSLKKLDTVLLCHARNLTDGALKCISHIDNLRKIDLTYCSDITKEGLIAAFTQQPFHKLEVLILQGVRSVCDEVLEAILPMVPNILCLDLNYTEVDELGLISIVKYNKRLRILSLSRSNLSYNKSIYSNSHNINKLKELRELTIDFKPINDRPIPSIKLLCLEKLAKINLKETKYGACSTALRKYVSRVKSRPPPYPKSGLAAFIDACPALEAVNIPLYHLDPSHIDVLGLSPRAWNVLCIMEEIKCCSVLDDRTYNRRVVLSPR